MLLCPLYSPLPFHSLFIRPHRRRHHHQLIDILASLWVGAESRFPPLLPHLPFLCPFPWDSSSLLPTLSSLSPFQFRMASLHASETPHQKANLCISKVASRLFQPVPSNHPPSLVKFFPCAWFFSPKHVHFEFFQSFFLTHSSSLENDFYEKPRESSLRTRVFCPVLTFLPSPFWLHHQPELLPLSGLINQNATSSAKNKRFCWFLRKLQSFFINSGFRNTNSLMITYQFNRKVLHLLLICGLKLFTNELLISIANFWIESIVNSFAIQIKCPNN